MVYSSGGSISKNSKLAAHLIAAAICVINPISTYAIGGIEEYSLKPGSIGIPAPAETKEPALYKSILDQIKSVPEVSLSTATEISLNLYLVKDGARPGYLFESHTVLNENLVRCITAIAIANDLHITAKGPGDLFVTSYPLDVDKLEDEDYIAKVLGYNCKFPNAHQMAYSLEFTALIDDNRFPILSFLGSSEELKIKDDDISDTRVKLEESLQKINPSYKVEIREDVSSSSPIILDFRDRYGKVLNFLYLISRDALPIGEIITANSPLKLIDCPLGRGVAIIPPHTKMKLLGIEGDYIDKYGVYDSLYLKVELLSNPGIEYWIYVYG